MTIRGRVQQGVVVLDCPGALPEEAEVEVVFCRERSDPQQPRQGGMWMGQVHVADDFDELPDGIAEAFGMRNS